MGRDLGYRGGRRTGIALTDEAHLPCVGDIYRGVEARRSTVGAVVAERTAAEIWSILKLVDAPPLLWNVFPLHPHESGNHLSNRKFTAAELAVAEDLNRDLIRMLRIESVVAIGQDAGAYSQRLGVEVVQVRHPSYGGVREFRGGMSSIYGIAERGIQPSFDF